MGTIIVGGREIGHFLSKEEITKLYMLYKETKEECKDKESKEKNMKDFKIVDYKTYENTAVIVKFEDGTEEKAVCNSDDKFDLERGVEVCVLKHILGTENYKFAVRESMRQINAVDQERKNKEAQELAIAKKKEKEARRKARRKERRRNERIAEMKEAYLAAFNEHCTCKK